MMAALALLRDEMQGEVCNLLEAPWQNAFLARTQLISELIRGSLSI